MFDVLVVSAWLSIRQPAPDFSGDNIYCSKTAVSIQKKFKVTQDCSWITPNKRQIASHLARCFKMCLLICLLVCLWKNVLTVCFSVVYT